MKSAKSALAIILLLGLIACSEPPASLNQLPDTDKEHLTGNVSTYTLVLTDTTGGAPPWLSRLYAERPASAQLIISGYPQEGGQELLNRLPWLLQPGVDTIYYDPGLAGEATYRALVDSVAKWSPATLVRRAD